MYLLFTVLLNKCILVYLRKIINYESKSRGLNINVRIKSEMDVIYEIIII